MLCTCEIVGDSDAVVNRLTCDTAVLMVSARSSLADGTDVNTLSCATVMVMSA